MATYAIGDIQGCFDSFQRLLEHIGFSTARDKLWLVGDLVNRGPRSLDVLRWVYQNQRCLQTVLGNHDLHLLATSVGRRKKKALDTLDDILAAEDRDELLTWLRQQPLMVYEEPFILVHAGLHPLWTIALGLQNAGEVERVLRSDDWMRLAPASGKGSAQALPESQDPTSTDARRLQGLLAAFVLMRTCDAKGRLHPDFTGRPEAAPSGYLPWFERPQQRASDSCVVFGHWSTMGVRIQPGYMAIDSGCVWGGKLSAVRLEDRKLFQVDSVEVSRPRPGR